MSEKKDNRWLELRHDHCVVFLRMLACNNHLMPQTGSKLDWITSVFTKPEVKCIDDLLYQVLPVLDLSDQTHILTKSFNLKPKLIEAVIDNAKELMTSQCVIVIKSKTNETFAYVLSVTVRLN